MVTRYGVWLDGLPLHEIDPTIFITDIQEQEPQMDVLTAARALGDGLRVSKRTRQSLSVVVRFAIREYSTVRRKAVLQKVISWARKGRYLSISDRPGQRLRVEMNAPPAMSSALKWTQELTLTLTAYSSPFWEDATTTKRSGNGSMYVPGDAPSVTVDAIITDAPETLTITAGETSMTLEGLTAGATVKILHEDGVVKITENDASALHKRTAASADELRIVPGRTNQVSSSGGQATFTARGCWL